MPIDAPLLRALQLEAPARIAEVGCGGGGTAIEILRQAPTGSIVHGFDVSPVLIERARARTRTDPSAPVFALADMATAQPEKPYDRLVSRFGVMFFDDPHAAFANLKHWLEPGGRFAFAVWGPASENPWTASVRDVVAQIVAMPNADPDAPGPFRYGDAAKFLDVLDHAGFTEVAAQDWRGTLSLGGGLPPAEAARFAIDAFSSFGALLAKAGDAALNEAHRSLTSVFSDYQEDGVVRVNAFVRIFTGRRP